MDGTDKTDTDKTAETAAAVAKREPGADFEPGPGSPLNADGSPRWSAVKAADRHAEATILNEQAEAAKGREATMSLWWPKDE